MDVPYITIFVGLLVAYMAYSVWANVDGRYPIGAALALLVVTAVVDAAGDTNAANELAEFVFFLLAGGVVLLLIEHVRDRSSPNRAPASGGGPPQGVPPEASEERKRPTDQALHGLEEKPVPLVDRPGGEDRDHEEQRDADSEDGQRPEGKLGMEDPEDKADGNGGGDERGHEVPVERMDPRQPA